MKIALFVPCYVDQVVPSVAIATTKLLLRLGHEVIYPKEQTCCGQPAFNTGYWPEATSLACSAVKLFLSTNADAVVCPSGSCTAMQKVFYPTLLQGTPQEADAKDLADRTYELSQFLVDRLGLTDVGASFRGTAVLHKSCHGLRELNAKTQARTLLNQVRNLTMLDLADDEECCGFGGTFAVKSADISCAMGEVKCQAIRSTNAEWVISGDSSCLFHLGGLLEKQKAPVKSIHLAEVLASQQN